ncbi:hypothetical protein DESUT3_11880 [Desulfuromonas versatilis]|uniref:Uncharacterized protein n=1 Tax=Desulfuromonas versatilis TaxID=2802975 RepID=A0ABN6DX58_9BACT|nr:hypothetical protein DESUT3_11880 [Desulfuromonas versatilis]
MMMQALRFILGSLGSRAAGIAAGGLERRPWAPQTGPQGICHWKPRPSVRQGDDEHRSLGFAQDLFRGAAEKGVLDGTLAV